jgi:hypothetical protein
MSNNTPISWEQALDKAAISSNYSDFDSFLDHAGLLPPDSDGDLYINADDIKRIVSEAAIIHAESIKQAAVEKMQQDAHLLITRYASNIASNCQNPHHASIEILRMENPFKHHDWKEGAARKGIQI